MVRGPRLAVPPGRAGRLWLEQRLEVARRGAGTLDRKLRILSIELERLRAEAAATSRDWEQRCTLARAWLMRASLLAGDRAVRLATSGEFAEVTVWQTVTMGAHHPQRAICVTPGSTTWDGQALAFARSAHVEALEAAVRHAAAAAAVRIVEAEAAATRRRLRAIRDRWIPRLEEALAEVKFALEEQERADGARLRQAMRGQERDSAAGRDSRRPRLPP